MKTFEITAKCKFKVEAEDGFQAIDIFEKNARDELAAEMTIEFPEDCVESVYEVLDS